MARRTKAECEATRNALLDAAEAVFLEQGVSRTSLEQIARHAGMTRGALYWHFKDKDALFEAVREQGILVLEVPVKGATRHACMTCNLFTRGACYALF